MNSRNTPHSPGRTLLVLGVGLLGFVLAQTSVVPALGQMQHAFGASLLEGGPFVPPDRFTPVVSTEEAARSSRPPQFLANSSRPGLRITMGARRRDFEAAPPGIERVMRPFDR